MAKNNNKFEMEGVVTERLKGGLFKVKLTDNNYFVDCRLSGRLQINHIHILEGDKVTVEMDTVDITKGRIVWRYK